MDINSFKRDVSTREDGEWVGDIPNLGNVRLKVRGMASDAFRTAMSKKEKAIPMAERERDGEAMPSARKRIMQEAIAETILLDWDGFTKDGAPLPYSLEVAKEYIANPDFELFADAIVWAARVVDNGKAIITDNDVKKHK